MPGIEEPLILSVDYRSTEKELIRALQYHDWGNPVARRRLLLRCGAFALAGIAGFAGGMSVGAEWLLGLSTLLLMIGIYWPLILVGHPKGLAKLYAKHPRFQDPTTATVRPNALVLTSAHSERRLDWQSIRKIVVAGELTLFGLGRYEVVCIPWRCFNTPSAAQRYTELAREYWLTIKDAPLGALALPENVAEALGPERVVVQYDLTQREVRLLIAGQIRRKPRFLLSVVIVAVGVGLFEGALAGPVWGVGLALGVAALMLALVMGLAIFSARSSKGVMGTHLLAAGPGALWSTTSEHMQSWTKWSNITQIEGTQTEILLFKGPDFVTAIPRRCFASPQEADHFLTQLSRWRVASLSDSSTSTG